MFLASSFFSNLGADAIGGLVVFLVTIVGGAWMSQRREKKAEKKEGEQSVIRKLEKLDEMAGEMHVALVGGKKTPFNPNPPPGLVDIVPDLLRRTTRIEHTLFTNGGANNTVLDRLGRIEDAAANNQSSSNRIETHQADQEAARVMRANGE